MEISVEAKRIKLLREELKLTQTEFAQELGIKTTADIERSKTKLSGFIVMKLLKDHQINPLWLFGESQQKHISPNHIDIAPKTVTIDNTGSENILMVNQKAAAGYAHNIGDPTYYQSLPAFSFPLAEYRNASFRGFQVEGYSMSPVILPNEWIIAQAISKIDEVKSNNIYVIVETESVRIKKVINKSNSQELELISLNLDYPTDTIHYSKVKEIWKFHSKLTTEIDISTNNRKLEEIQQGIVDIKELLKKEK